MTTTRILALSILLGSAAVAAEAGQSCEKGSIPYTLDWSTAGEFAGPVSGRPEGLLAHPGGRFARTAPDIFIRLSYGGLIRRFAFDRPDVSLGGLEISHDLTRHDEYTTVSFGFPVPVDALSLGLEGLDENISFPAGYSDRVKVTGHHALVLEDRIVAGGELPADLWIRGEDRQVALGRNRNAIADGQPPSGTAFPYPNPLLERGGAWKGWIADFPIPVSGVDMRLSSESRPFGGEEFIPNPDPQSVTVTSVGFCVRKTFLQE